VTAGVVTYVRPDFGGNDGPGMYVQESNTGPAIFVQGAQAGSIAVGDRVSFTATETEVVEGRIEISAITGLVESGTGAVATQNFANDDQLVLGILDRESEMQRTTVTLTGDVTGNAGGAFRKATATTTALVVAPTNISVRLSAPVLAAADLRTGCIVTVESPMGRATFAATEAQFTAWELSQIVSATECLATVEGATATDATTVAVTFSRSVDPASVLANGSQFSIAGLTVTAATVSGSVVTLTTETQGSGTDYTVEVSTTVLDAFGSLYDESASTAAFQGFAQAAACPAAGGGLFISEVADTATTGARFVELFNASATAIDLSTTSVQLRLYSNGSATPSNTVTLAGVIPSCSTFIVANNLANFTLSYVGVVANQASAGVVNSNGDDAFDLVVAGTQVDAYGVIGTDGTGEPWEFADAVVGRKLNVIAGTTTFNLQQWTIAADTAPSGSVGNPGTR